MIKAKKVSDERICQYYVWCQDAFSAVGRRLQFPKGTDQRKTYQWRYLNNLALKVASFGFDDAAAKFFIQVIAEYAKDHRLLDKGLAIFCQSNILDICRKQLDVRQKALEQQLQRLQFVVDWMHTSDGRRQMTFRANPDASPNLVEWYRSGHVNNIFIAFSKSASAAYSELRPKYSESLPTQQDIYLLRMRLSENLDFMRKAKALLRDDWRP